MKNETKRNETKRTSVDIPSLSRNLATAIFERKMGCSFPRGVLSRRVAVRERHRVPLRVSQHEREVEVRAARSSRGLRVEGPYEATNVGAEFKGVRSGVERPSSRCVGIESEGPWAERIAGRESP